MEIIPPPNANRKKRVLAEHRGAAALVVKLSMCRIKVLGKDLLHRHIFSLLKDLGELEIGNEEYDSFSDSNECKVNKLKKEIEDSLEKSKIYDAMW